MKSLNNAEFVDIRADGIPFETLERAEQIFGSSLVTSRSTTWRGLTESERKRPALELLADHPALMKRPLIVDGDRMFLGWTDDTRQALGVA